MVSANQNDQISEEANNVYSLPSIPQTLTYLHAAAGFPVKETWMDAINAGNLITWPILTILVFWKHFPDSNETQKGHMKKQRQGVSSTKLKREPYQATQSRKWTQAPQIKWETYSLKYITPAKCTATKQDTSQQHQAKATNISWC